MNSMVQRICRSRASIAACNAGVDAIVAKAWGGVDMMRKDSRSLPLEIPIPTYPVENATQDLLFLNLIFLFEFESRRSGPLFAWLLYLIGSIVTHEKNHMLD